MHASPTMIASMPEAAFAAPLHVRLLPSTVSYSFSPRLCKRPRAATWASLRATLTANNASSNGAVPSNGSTSANGSVYANGASQSAKRSAETLAKPLSPTVRFLQVIWQSWRLLIPALAFGVIGSVCSVFQPLLFGRIIGILSRAEFLVASEARRLVFERTARLCMVYCIELISTLCFVTLLARVIDRATRRLRETAFERVLKNDVGFFDTEGRGEIVRNLSEEIKTIREAVWGNLGRDRGIRAVLDCLFGVSLSFYITGSIGAPIFGGLVPVISTIVAQMGLRNGRVAARMGLKDNRVRNFLDERMRGVRTIKAFGAERRERRALGVLLDDVERGGSDFGKSKAITEAANRVSIYVTIAAFFILGGLLIIAGEITFELFSCVTGFIWILNFAMQGISYSITDMAKAGVALRNVYDLVDKADGYRSENEGKVEALGRVKGEVEFRDVTFHYPSRPEVQVLKGINFRIRQGEMVALVGDSGGGKSTIAAMLSRFYAPSSGTVLLDGKNIHNIPSEQYARLISVVDQDPVLFQGTIRENIAYGLPDEMVDDNAIVQATVEANAHGFITKLSKGYDTVWTPASNLSGGQRQRIAIARGLLKSPPLLVLDEATSALDEESMRMVQNALERIMANRSVLIIAHRLSTVRSADAILFVKDGKIVERGTYDELVARPNGYLKSLVDSTTEVLETSTLPP